MKLSDLETWLDQKTDGDWEHQGGLTIESTDNPGWHIRIDYSDIKDPLVSDFSGFEIERSQSDFVVIVYDEVAQTLNGTCGVGNLVELMQKIFALETGKEPVQM